MRLLYTTIIKNQNTGKNKILNGMEKASKYVKSFDELSSDDVSLVGGKNASLGEMISLLKKEGIKVPEGFATTADAYWKFLDTNEVRNKISSILQQLKSDNSNLADIGKSVRELILKSRFPGEVESEIIKQYDELSRTYQKEEADVAVRSSATAEDLPGASFAGQQESFLNVRGKNELLKSCKECYASLFTDRAISYRKEKGFDHMKVALSIGVQKMIRSDIGSSGVMFTIDTETGFKNVVVINAAWGLGENVVQGSVNPDEYRILKPLVNNNNFKPILSKELGDKAKKMVYGKTKTTKNVNTTDRERKSFVLIDDEILKLSRWAVIIEKHYDRPMDIEWAKDGEQKELYIVQARPETVQSQKSSTNFKSYKLNEKGNELISGVSIGGAVAAGKSQVIKNVKEINRFEDNAILVTEKTDPDWVPIMKRASGIITDYGGRTSHAAIVSRELGIPAIVGTGNATKVLKDGEEITISCLDGENGHVYEGILKFEEKEIDLKDIKGTRTKIEMNIANPGAAFRWWRLPCDGIGLARMEFIINNIIKIHPMALICFDELKDKKAKVNIEKLTEGYENKPDYFIDKLSRGIATIAASQYPGEVVVRMSDFKSNEYADLIGGKEFEPAEANPMLGFRGASRYYSKNYKQGFTLECKAVKKAREEIGLNNIVVMIPFCRTISEADKVLNIMAENELIRGENGLKIYVMAEVPSNIFLAEQFAQRFDAFSIGSNDLTQLVLGVDRDSSGLSGLFDERDEAVKKAMESLIHDAHKNNRKVSICGQAPSDYPEIIDFLVEAGIDSISLNPDSVLEMKQRVASLEETMKSNGKEQNKDDIFS
jgi:pyruvate,water dikinase